MDFSAKSRSMRAISYTPVRVSTCPIEATYAMSPLADREGDGAAQSSAKKDTWLSNPGTEYSSPHISP